MGMAADHIKANGVHYTPPTLAAFLASVTAASMGPREGVVKVLDPACGNGALLLAFAQALPPEMHRRVILHGYETDLDSLRTAKALLADSAVKEVVLEQRDFLSIQGVDADPRQRQLSLLDKEPSTPTRLFDAIIANPPYVRTQVLGAAKSQDLARRFRLTGRVDLYHAFAKAMASLLKPGGVLGLLTSNRFLTIRSGEALRHLLRTAFSLEAIYDLGDTRLFSAAVLPVIVVAKRQLKLPHPSCSFDRVYEYRAETNGDKIAQRCPTILEAVKDKNLSGLVYTDAGVFRIERGVLKATQDDETWSLSTPDYDGWLQSVKRQQAHSFGDIALIRVGIKTTADEVFIRDDWDSLPTAQRPEGKLLRPLLTHLNARKWVAFQTGTARKVLYPHQIANGRRVAIDLGDYPRAKVYLESHRERLTRRKYVIDAGRQWFEIWVPHQPTDWGKPKIVFPDIAEEPRFFLDSTGAVANGDCYWITLRAGFEPDWLFLILAVANSSFIKKYYDVTVHNKLYAGRRRFMTQYVKNFPLPRLSTPLGQQIVRLVREAVDKDRVNADAEAKIDELVWQAFGLVKEVAR